MDSNTITLGTWEPPGGPSMPYPWSTASLVGTLMSQSWKSTLGTRDPSLSPTSNPSELLSVTKIVSLDTLFLNQFWRRSSDPRRPNHCIPTQPSYHTDLPRTFKTKARTRGWYGTGYLEMVNRHRLNIRSIILTLVFTSLKDLRHSVTTGFLRARTGVFSQEPGARSFWRPV